MAENLFDGIELSDDLLDGIAGGFTSEKSLLALDSYLQLVSSRGGTVDQAIDRLALANPKQALPLSLPAVHDLIVTRWPIS